MTADSASPAAPDSENAPEPSPVVSPGGEGPAEASGRSPREAELEAELAAVKDKALRAMAEAENTRRRVETEKIEAIRYAAADFAREIVPVADNLGRALSLIAPEARAKDPALETLAVGVEMTERALLAVFERFGIRRIEALGKRFDPYLHEAMFEIEDKDKTSGTVVQELEAGYVMHNRPLRAAKVAIAKGGPVPTQNQNAASIPAEAGEKKPGAYDRPAGGTGTKLDEQL
ncbi:MAG: nucleotide exchange factor GrpE [Rhodospirillales bacterium RIFCSPLOWO2_12_FULL_67_15]|nr:MAG: nucleotide exchange factor GrpE [Rhodospirillales bacterium RIFCSPLOWO2_12_FULL_67_15]